MPQEEDLRRFTKKEQKIGRANLQGSDFNISPSIQDTICSRSDNQTMGRKWRSSRRDLLLGDHAASLTHSSAPTRPAQTNPTHRYRSPIATVTQGCTVGEVCYIAWRFWFCRRWDQRKMRRRRVRRAMDPSRSTSLILPERSVILLSTCIFASWSF
jgi:hypothetical protein